VPANPQKHIPTCCCPSPQATRDDEGELACFYCNKPYSQARGVGVIKGKTTRAKVKPKRAEEFGKVQPTPFPHPEQVWNAILEARVALGIGDENDGFSIPDKLFKLHFSEEAVERLWDNLTKNQDLEDPALLKKAVEASTGIVGDGTALLFILAGRLALAGFAANAQVLSQEMRTAEEVQEYQRTLGQLVSVGLQADQIRRRFGLSINWSAEMAIICGPGRVPAPFTEAMPRSESKTVLQRLSCALFGSEVQPLDDRQRVQIVRDQVHEAFEQLSTLLKERFGGRYPKTSVKNGDGTFQEVDDPEVALYNIMQAYIPDYVRQPLSDTATPRRVMAQRSIDARKRRNKRRQPRIRYALQPPYDPSEENGKIPYSSLGTLSVE
jgi:hypothetical protein